jgi:predicted AlkP superfamily phosphohydrolase/phosphomutase
MNKPPRAVFIGLDSLDPGLLGQWSDEGLLPNIRALRQAGTCAHADMPVGLGAAAMWMSLATGVHAGRHGRYYGRQFDGATYATPLFDASDLDWETFWVALSRAGKRVGVIDFPMAPLARNLNGLQIVDWGTHDPASPDLRTWPPHLAARVRAEVGADPVGRCDLFPLLTPADYGIFRDRLMERIGRRTALVTKFLGQESWDLFAVVFSEGHCAGHQCWHVHDPFHPKHNAQVTREVGDVVRDIYIALDQAIGRIVVAADPDTLFFVFAGSGMGPNFTCNHLLEEILRAMEGARSTERVALLTALRRLGRKLVPLRVRDMLRPLGGRAIEAALPSQRRKWQYFSIPHNDLSGAVRINLVGREADGRVLPGREYEDLCAAIAKELLQIRDMDSGAPIVSRVVRSSDLYRGEHLNALPDLLIEWNRHRQTSIRSVVSPRIGTITQPPVGRRTGDHYPGGILFVKGREIRPACAVDERLKIESIPVAICRALGVQLDGVDGVAPDWFPGHERRVLGV